MRVVIDSSVVVAAARSQAGASSHVLALVAYGKLTMLASPALFLEYEAVLKRATQMQDHGWSVDEVDGFLRALAQRLEAVEIYFQWKPQLEDPGDESVLEVAVNGRAEALVTHNTRHFQPLHRNFGIPVLTPSELIRRLQHE